VRSRRIRSPRQYEIRVLKDSRMFSYPNACTNSCDSEEFVQFVLTEISFGPVRRVCVVR
jgi:hypothetical protein